MFSNHVRLNVITISVSVYFSMSKSKVLEQWQIHNFRYEAATLRGEGANNIFPSLPKDGMRGNQQKPNLKLYSRA